MKAENLRKIAAAARVIRNEMENIKQTFSLESDRYVGYEVFAKLYNDLAREYEDVTGISQLRKIEIRKFIAMDWHSMRATFQETYTKVGILESLISTELPVCDQVNFGHLIHPRVHEVAMRHYLNGDFRNAVLDSILCVSTQ